MPWQADGINYDAIRAYASLSGSAIALFSTFYFWLVRANRERGNLAVYPIGELDGCVVLPNYAGDTYRRLNCQDDQYPLIYWLHVAVVNNSALPNALLGVKAWMQFSDGGWRQMDVQPASPEQELFPLNISPLTTASVKLALATRFAGEFENDNRGRAAAAGDAVPRQIPIRLELIGLQEQVFTQQWLDCGDGLSRTQPLDAEQLAESQAPQKTLAGEKDERAAA